MRAFLRTRFRLLLLNILLGLGVLAAVLWVDFDANWLRGPLESYLSERSGREVRIGDLKLTLGLNPSVRFRDLHVPNADWGGDRPLIDAREAEFTLSLRTLWDERRVLSMVTLRDAEVNMEWLADGRRNWRLTNPDYRGQGRFKVMRLDAVRTTLRFVNHGAGLDLRTAASEPEGGDPAFNTRVAFDGRYQGRAFEGHVLTDMPLPMQDSKESVPLRGHMRWSGTGIDVDGRIADFWRPSMVDASVHVKGPSLADLHPFVRAALPQTRPYVLVGQVRQSDTAVTNASLRGKIGSSAVKGELRYERGERPRMDADLHLDKAKLTDFAVASEDAAPEDARLFPSDRFKTGRLGTTDVRLRLDAKELRAAGLVLSDLRMEAALEGGTLQVKPLSFGLAGGRVTTSLQAEDGDGSLSVRARADLDDVRLEQLPWLAQRVRIAGPLDGKLALSGRGDSMTALMADMSGRLDARLESGRLSRMADAKMALDGGRILAATFGRDRDIDILGGTAGIEFQKGLGRVDALSLETERTRLEGSGRIDLRSETLDLLLTPHPKDPTLFSMSGAFAVTGPLRKPGFTLRRAAADGDAAAEKRTTATRKE
jgi:uncharacterized protein involved in outer membrane biogenesis